MSARYDDRPLLPERPREALDQPPCKWCGGRQWVVLGDEPQACWCVREREVAKS